MRRSIGLAASLVMTMGLGLVSALPAQANGGAVSDIKIAVVSDGTAPFTTEAGPGLDDGPSNGVVRTQDTVRYNVVVSYDTVGDVVLTSTLPQGMEWDATATASTVCNGPGGGALSADKRTWTCNRTADGLSESFDLFAWVYAVGDGTQVAPEITSGSVTGVAPAVTVSATPKTELRTWTYSTNFSHNISNAGALGFRYTIVNFLGATSPSGDLRGYEALEGPITYVMSVPEGAVVLSSSTTYSGGTLRLAQAAPGGDVTVTVTGARTDYGKAVVPGVIGALPNDFWNIGSATLAVWVPYDPTLPPGQTTTISSQISGFDPTGLSGVSNFGDGYAPGQEPGYACPAGSATGQQLSCFVFPVDRSATLAVAGTASAAMHTATGTVNGGAYLLGDGHGFTQGQEKIVPGQSFFAPVGLYNRADALSAATAPYGCAVWDNTYLAIGSVPKAIYRKSTSSEAFYLGSGLPIATGSAVVEYSAQTFTTDAERKAFDCGTAGDRAAGWVSSPTELVGGLASVTAVRMSSSLTLDPGTAVGLMLPLKRTTTAASLALPVNKGLPWFWQYGTAETPLVKSTYSGAGNSVAGGYVQAVPSLVRATTSWSDSSVDPGSISSVVVQPLVIGPVGAGVDTTATNVAVKVTMASVCAEPVEASLQALVANGAITSYDYTPGVIAGDGINCANGGTPATITMRMGDVVAPGGAVGGSFAATVGGHQSSLQSLSFQVTNSVLTPSGSTHVATTLISADTDTSYADWTGVLNQGASAPLTDRTTSASLVVTGVASFKGGKTASTAIAGKVAPGEAFAYTINWANGTSKEVGEGTFVDLLPYDGDARGTSGLGTAGLQVVDVAASTSNPVMGEVSVAWTTDPAADVASALAQLGNEDGRTGIVWQDGPVPAGATALRFTTSKPVSPGYSGSATMTVKAPTLAIGGTVKNNMYGRTAPVGGDEDTVMAFRAAAGVSLTSSAGALSGTVYQDLDFDGVLDTDVDAVWPSAATLRADSVANSYTSELAGGDFLVTPVAPGDYTMNLLDQDGWTRISPEGTLAVASGQEITGQAVLFQEKVANPVLVDDAATVTQGESTVVDVTSTDTLAFPTAEGSQYTVDGVALGGLAPTSGSVELVAPTGTATQSTIRYTASADWPEAHADATRYTDSFTYSWTNAVGVTRSATVTVTVYRPVVATDDVARIPDAATAVDLLTNDTGDGLAISGTPTVTGDATITVDAGTVVVTPTHQWADGEATHTVTVDYTLADSRAQTATGTATVTVQRPPVVVGEDVRTIAENASVDLGFTVLAPDRLTTTTLTTPPAAGEVALDQAAGMVTFDSDGAAPDVYTFTLTFVDDLGQQTDKTYEVTVQAAPEAISPEAVTVPLGGRADFTTEITDGTHLRSAVLVGPGEGFLASEGVAVDAAVDGVVSFEAGELAGGTYTFVVVFTDDLGQTTRATYTVTVQEPPTATGPVTALTGTAQPTSFDTVLTTTGAIASAAVTTEPEAGTVTVTSDGHVSYDPDGAAEGEYTFVVVYTDDLGQTVEVTYVVTVQAAPVVTGTTDRTIGTGQTATIDLAVTTTGTVREAVVQTPPTAGTAAVSTDGTVVFEAGDAAPGVYTFTVVFTDDLGQTTTVDLSVTVRAGVAVEDASAKVAVDGLVSLEESITTDGHVVSREVVEAPAAGTVTLGSVLFDAVGAAPGEYTFVVRYTDDLGLTADARYTVTVQAPPEGEGTAVVLDSDEQTVTFDPIGDTTGVGLQQLGADSVGTPSRGTVALSEGTVTYVPERGWAGTTSFVVLVRDDLGQQAALTYTVTVEAPVVPAAPDVAAGPTDTAPGTVGEASAETSTGLAQTGAYVLRAGGIALVALLAGTLLLVAVRRRRRGENEG